MRPVDLVVIAQFLSIHEKEGPEAACKWAEEQCVSLEELESSGTVPDLRIVR